MARDQVKLKKAVAAALSRGALVQDGKAVAHDPWIVLGDADAAPEGGDIVISLARFKAEREALLARNSGRLGITLAAADAVEEIGEEAHRFALIMVQFPAFRDGRGFTTARLLRERYLYAGELRAAGDVLEDQIFFMLRCGFDAFEIVSSAPESAFARAAKTFSAAYQPAADGRAPAYRLRAGKPAS